MEGVMLFVFLFLIALGIGNLVKKTAENPAAREAGLGLLNRWLKK